MTTLIVYDSTYGNTERLARTMQAALGGDCQLLRAGDVRMEDLVGVDRLIVGSPTQGGRPTQAVGRFLGGIPAGSLRGVFAAAFDTRMSAREQALWLRALMRIIGFAAPKIGRALESKGARLAVPPEGFIVEGKEGPLRAGEEERAASWTRSIAPPAEA